MKRNTKYILSFLLVVIMMIAVFFLCVFSGSTGFSFTGDIVSVVRLPRVIVVALIGAALSVCGAAMQGLLRNPLADGTTLGVSSGSSLGAVIAICATSVAPWISEVFGGVTVVFLSMIFGLLSLMFIMWLSYKVDSRLSTNTIILVGVVFSMFASALISLLVALFPENAKTVTFWTMGSTSSADYADCVLLLIAFIICGVILLFRANELNTFAIGEDNASHLGVDVQRIKMIIMVAVSVLIGACVSVSGTIGFVGLVVPHIGRLIVGPNHKKLLPFSIVFGSTFLMLCDLFCRTILAPRELPIGVITSLIGAIVFVSIFIKNRKGSK